MNIGHLLRLCKIHLRINFHSNIFKNNTDTILILKWRIKAKKSEIERNLFLITGSKLSLKTYSPHPFCNTRYRVAQQSEIAQFYFYTES